MGSFEKIALKRRDFFVKEAPKSKRRKSFVGFSYFK